MTSSPGTPCYTARWEPGRPFWETWGFSAVKRQMNLKDYGNLIPGHGGILDRFDSMMLVAPLMEILLRMLPFAVPTIGAG